MLTTIPQELQQCLHNEEIYFIIQEGRKGRRKDIIGDLTRVTIFFLIVFLIFSTLMYAVYLAYTKGEMLDFGQSLICALLGITCILLPITIKNKIYDLLHWEVYYAATTDYFIKYDTQKLEKIPWQNFTSNSKITLKKQRGHLTLYRKSTSPITIGDIDKVQHIYQICKQQIKLATNDN